MKKRGTPQRSPKILPEEEKAACRGKAGCALSDGGAEPGVGTEFGGSPGLLEERSARRFKQKGRWPSKVNLVLPPKSSAEGRKQRCAIGDVFREV